MIKKFKNLIDDNRLLNEALNEKGNKLNDFIIENENLRLQINNYIDNETKYKLQFQYYEKQIKLYETNINDYNKIVQNKQIDKKDNINKPKNEEPKKEEIKKEEPKKEEPKKEEPKKEINISSSKKKFKSTLNPDVMELI